MDKREFLNKGFQYFAIKDFGRAITFFEKALEADDRFEAAYSALAETYNRMGEIDAAIPIVKKWIEVNKYDPLAHAALSRLYVQKGMRDEAEKAMAVSNFLASQNK